MRFLELPSTHFFLLGPRGTGKTMWTRDRFPEALEVDLLNLLYRGKERLLRQGILCIPCSEFLLQLKPGESLPTA